MAHSFHLLANKRSIGGVNLSSAESRRVPRRRGVNLVKMAVCQEVTPSLSVPRQQICCRAKENKKIKTPILHPVDVVSRVPIAPFLSMWQLFIAADYPSTCCHSGLRFPFSSRRQTRAAVKKVAMLASFFSSKLAGRILKEPLRRKRLSLGFTLQLHQYEFHLCSPFLS